MGWIILFIELLFFCKEQITYKGKDMFNRITTYGSTDYYPNY
ncbi:hypothetical protein GCM10008025_35880 [Ornithinibacillus halotolerans]|uniref:Uncharacterized protein n=1 Tax=Ornithinibacillus halotolerans TaxID=1274357 RepID=A0A916SBJ2_9BACI|nr:hypothetical protein GCM10008025_35880 [Ornithinibacillus halotolerans]